MFRTGQDYYGPYLGMWKVPRHGDPHPTRDTLFPLDIGIQLRHWRTDPVLQVPEVQLQNQIEHFDALRQLAAGPRRHRSREPTQNKLNKQRPRFHQQPRLPEAVLLKVALPQTAGVISTRFS